MEPVITINGVVLEPAHSMTIRVALNNFALDLQNDGLGNDKHGVEMTKQYLARISEINSIIHISSKS